MAIFRDPSFVKTLAESIEIDEISDEACKEILFEVENKLRFNALKYMKHFNREKLKMDDFNFSMKDLNIYDKIYGYSLIDKIEYTKHGDVWALNNNEIDLRNSLIKDVERLKKPIKPTISFKWLSVDGNIPKTTDNSSIICKNDIINKIKEDNIEKNGIEKISGKEIHLIDHVQSILSKEMQQFLDLIIVSLNNEEQNIDENLLKGKYVENENIRKVLINLNTSSGINNMLPFLLNFMSSHYDTICYNGYEKKIIQAKVLGALINNNNLNHEFYIHIFVKILLHFITSNKISLNYSSKQFELREISSRLLVTLIILYEDKYLNLKNQICNLLVDLLKEDYFNYQTSIGIFSFFSFMTPIIIYTMILPSICYLLESSQFQNDMHKIFQMKDNDFNNLEKKENKKLISKTSDEEIIKSNEAHYLYNLIMKCCCKLISNLIFLSNYSEKETSKLYEYLYSMLGEIIIPYVLRNFIYNNNTGKKILRIYQNFVENKKTIEVSSQMEMFL